MALSRLDIKNMALADIPAQRIETEDEISLEAETMAEVYQPALESLVEEHDWDFATVRVPLAVVANDRAQEWHYAYQLPSGLAKPLRVMPWMASDASPSSPTYPVHGRLRGFEGRIPYRVAGDRLYTTQQAAVLEFITTTPSEARFTAKFAKALALECAARGCMPIAKDSKRQQELISLAAIALDRAKAADMNRDRETPNDFMNEEQLVRMGAVSWQ